MRVERELEIGRWLKTAKTEMEIKPNQYFALVKLLEDFHNEQLRLYGVSKSFSEGVKVQIIANTRGHDFEIGEIVTIGIQDNDMWLAHGEKSSWWIAEHEANVC